MNKFTYGVLSIITLFIVSCSSSAPTVGTTNSTSNSIFPGWYNQSGFFADGVAYHGFATAVSADSVTAIERAELKARTTLGKNIGEITENIRVELDQGGSSNVGNTDFIIILRTAHTGVELESTLTESLATKVDGYYRGFAKVEISRAQAASVLETGFTGHPRYWGEFSSSEGYKSSF
ncbi:MAG: hypothetical protein ED557_13300 [Balneola sp.]|nr:MAG: hypothetical protein ED557_13300 [Balneola sp.]